MSGSSLIPSMYLSLKADSKRVLAVGTDRLDSSLIFWICCNYGWSLNTFLCSAVTCLASDFLNVSRSIFFGFWVRAFIIGLLASDAGSDDTGAGAVDGFTISGFGRGAAVATGAVTGLTWTLRGGSGTLTMLGFSLSILIVSPVWVSFSTTFKFRGFLGCSVLTTAG